jgi:hypothetical protein
LAVGQDKKAQVDSSNARRLDPGSPLAFFLESKIRDKNKDIDGAYNNAVEAYRLASEKTRFFSSPEGDAWLRYYADVMIRYKAAHK